MLYYFSVYNICLHSFHISCLFSGGITIFRILIDYRFWLHNFVPILFPINSAIASAALWNNDYQADFRVSTAVLVAVSHFFSKLVR